MGRGEVKLPLGSEGCKDQRLRKKAGSDDRKKEDRREENSEDWKNAGRSTRRPDGSADSVN